VYVIDECHMLSQAAFNALLKTLEEPPNNVVFVLATTDPQRVLPTIISRCQRFDYRRIPLEPMTAHLRAIANQEAITIEDEALRLVAQVSQGGLRDAQSLLDQLSLLPPPVTAEAVWDLVGAVPERDLLALVQAILGDQGTTTLDLARKLMDRGREPLIVLQNLAGFYRDLLIAKTAADRLDLVAITPPTWAEMQSLVQGIEPQILLLGQQHLRSAEVQVKNTTQPRLWLEVTLLGLLPSAQSAPGHPAQAAVTAPTPGMAPQPQPAAPRPTPNPVLAPPTEADAPSPAVATPHGHSPCQPVDDGLPTPPSDPEVLQPGSPPPTPNENLEQLWLRVLAALEPLGTRALMQQQGSLLFFDGTVARIGINSRPLFKMAQGRVENVEAAFQRVLHQKVQVSLEVLPDPKPEAPTPPRNPDPGRETQPVAVDDQPPVKADLPAPSCTAPPLTSSVEPANPVSISPDPTTALPAMVSDFDRAVKNFAQFFNGQIVEVDEDLNLLLGSDPPKPSKAAAQQPSHPDKDVPF
ncbi:MAG TPA: DNA polymerase III subunit gamma/tau, partial [Leptolyngbyaceae cyanobacterium M65_K2018_010]|nr:DNA polymerase III subunit gamma/tau [Leptolyngbyaceae cyanobacterium M65_K2018_010]